MIEPAAGVGRTVLAVLCDAYDEEEVAGEQRTRAASCTRGWRRSRSPCCRCVRKDGQPELAHEVFEALRGQMQAEYDEGGSIGKRYRRQDEIGTPFCVTIDHQSLEDRTVTVRDRDSLAQERVAVDELPAVLGARLAAPWRTPKLAAARAVARPAGPRGATASSSCGVGAGGAGAVVGGAAGAVVVARWRGGRGLCCCAGGTVGVVSLGAGVLSVDGGVVVVGSWSSRDVVSVVFVVSVFVLGLETTCSVDRA